MDKAPPTAPAHKTWATLIRDLFGRRRWTYTLFFGATAGTAVGVLNLVAVANQWKPEYVFEALDRPIIVLMDAARGWSDSTDWTWVFYYAPALLVMIAYWAITGTLLALVFCLLRDAIVFGVARDKTLRRALFFAGCGGMLICGGLRLLTFFNGWDGLEYYFEDVNWPASILNTMEHWLGIVPIPPSPHAWLAAQVCNWAAVGWFLGSFICLVWAIRKRKGAAKTRVSEECLSEQ